MVELKLCNSNSEAKKLIDQGAVKIDDKTITDKDFLFKPYILYINPIFMKKDSKSV